MTDKGFYLFDECAFRYVHLSSQEEECTSSSREGSKMYIFGSMANSQRILAEINESSTKKKILVKSDTVKHLKAFGIILKEIPISLLIYVNYILVVSVFRIFLVFFHMSLKCFFKSLFQVIQIQVSCFGKS